MQSLPTQVCNHCKIEKLLLEFTFYKKTAKYNKKCKDCIKQNKIEHPNEWERMRRNSPQPHRYILAYFPDHKKKVRKPDMGRMADGSSFSF